MGMGLTPSERVNVRAVVPITLNLVLFQDVADLVKFVLAQCDVHRSKVFQDPRLVRRTRDRDDVGTYSHFASAMTSTPLGEARPGREG
jgi:hypothetical protein